jgi:hypothetical protein
VAIAEVLGINLAYNLVNQALPTDYSGDFGVGGDTWRRNIGHGFTWDNDPFVINQFGHPYQGGTTRRVGPTVIGSRSADLLAASRGSGSARAPCRRGTMSSIPRWVARRLAKRSTGWPGSSGTRARPAGPGCGARSAQR